VSDGEMDDSDFHIVVSDLESDNEKDNLLLITCIFNTFALSQIHHCCEGDQSRALQEIPQFKLCYRIGYNSPPGDSSEN